METSIRRIEDLLSNKEIKNIEEKIANNVNCKIYKEDKLILLKLIQQNIIKSNLEIDKIESVMESESDSIIKFATQFLLEEKVESLSLGISILYTIYWIYLSSKTDKELLEYIKTRRIPKAKNVI